MGRKGIVFSIAAILVALLGIHAVYSGGVKKAANKNGLPSQKPVAVKTAAAVRGSISPSLTVTGSVAGDREVTLTAKTQGTVTSLGAGTGDRVSGGQVVVVLESINQQLVVDKSREQVAAASLALEKAKTDFARVDELYRQGAVSRAEYENAEHMLNNARVAYNIALSDNQPADRQLSEATVSAPFPG